MRRTNIKLWTILTENTVRLGKDFLNPAVYCRGIFLLENGKAKMSKEYDELNEVLEVLDTLKMLQTLRELSEETVQEWAMRMQDSINAEPEQAK